MFRVLYNFNSFFIIRQESEKVSLNSIAAETPVLVTFLRLERFINESSNKKNNMSVLIFKNKPFNLHSRAHLNNNG